MKEENIKLVTEIDLRNKKKIEIQPEIYHRPISGRNKLVIDKLTMRPITHSIGLL